LKHHILTALGLVTQRENVLLCDWRNSNDVSVQPVYGLVN